MIAIGTTLDEVLEVRGYHLEENAIWSLLRKILCILSQNQGRSTRIPTKISARQVLLLPNGQLKINTDDNCFYDHHHPSVASSLEETMKDLSMMLLWCSEYNLDSQLPLTISSNLQSLLTTMCDNSKICTIDHVQEICDHHLNAHPCNDSLIISDLCASVIGNVHELQNGHEHFENESLTSQTFKEPATDVNLSDSNSFTGTFSTSTSGHVSCFFGKYHLSSTPLLHEKRFSPIIPSDEKQTSSEFLTTIPDEMKKHKMKKSDSNLMPPCKYPGSVLDVDKSLKTICINSNFSAGVSTTILVSFVNHACVSVVVKNPATATCLDVIKHALLEFLPDSENELATHFGFAAMQDSDYHYFNHASTITKVLHDFPYTADDMFYIRILYFPPDACIDNDSLSSAMYIQLRADIVAERITCSHDDCLGLAALALQCEVGDYKVEYGCQYFVPEEFFPPHVLSKLGQSYIRSELPALHRQLAGIAEKEARHLFLRKSQTLEEYGMNFHKAYRLKSCKDENATWIGVGPRGIVIFDIKGNALRVRRHAFQWNELKKISFKSRKIVLTKMNPEVKLKFYERDISKTKYIVTVVGKLHKFYSEHNFSSQFTPVALFDDITKLSSTLNTSVQSQAATKRPSAHKSVESKSPSWTYNTPAFTRNKQVLRRYSNASSSSSVLGQQWEKRSHAAEVHSVPPKPVRNHSVAESSNSSSNTSDNLPVTQLQEVLDDSRSSDFSSQLNDQGIYENESTPPSSECGNLPTPMPRIKHKAKSHSQQRLVMAFNDPPLLAECDNNIHLTARNFYRNSLGRDRTVPAAVQQFNDACLKSLPRGAD